MFVDTGGQTKEEVIETNERLRIVRIRLDGSYEIAKRALVELMCKYTDSKQVRNVFQRYNLLKLMIKVITILFAVKIRLSSKDYQTIGSLFKVQHMTE